MILALFAAACADAPPERPASFVDPELRGAPNAISLTDRPAVWDVSGVVRSEVGNTEGAVELPITEAKVGAKRKAMTETWVATLPFNVGNDARKAAPRGMVVRVDDVTVPFRPDPEYRPNARSYSVRDRTLTLLWPVPPKRLTIAWPELNRSVDRHDLAAVADVNVAARDKLTLERVTRNGLMLPAPATATWTIDVPAGNPWFEAWLAMEPAPMESPAMDGATFVVDVIGPSGSQEVGRKAVPTGRFESIRWDLTAWAGQTVDLRIRSEAGGSPLFDWVFVGAPTVAAKPAAPPRTIVVIGLDTTRADKLAAWGGPPELAPELNGIVSTSTVFTHAFTPAPRTRPSFRAATTGRDPLEAVGATNIGQVFREEGFATAGIVANIHLQPRFDFDDGFDLWWFDGTARADEQVNRALTWLDDHRDRDTYLFLHFMDPHMGYGAPGGWRDMHIADPDPTLPEQFSRWQVLAWDAKGEIDDRRRAHIEGLYDGEMSFLSRELGRLYEALDSRKGPGLVVMHNDHGEEFWDHGGFEHNHALWPELTRAILLFRSGPGQSVAQQLTSPATLTDIAPTLYGFAGLADPPVTDGRDLSPQLLSGQPDPSDRDIGVAHLRYGKQQWGVVYKGHLHVHHTASGQEQLFDLASDPTAMRDLAATADLTPYREALGRAHRMVVGPGWRIDVDARGTLNPKPWVFELPAPALAAGVIDPEASIDDPANQEWGEPPRRVPAEIGTVAIDGTKMTWTPGSNPRAGILWVRFALPVGVDGLTVHHGENAVPVTPAPEGQAMATANWSRLGFRPGFVIEVPPSEAERIRTKREAATAEEMNALVELGYMDEHERAPH